MEFCLVSAERNSRWELPFIALSDGELPEAAARRRVWETTGLTCRGEPAAKLDEFIVRQNRQPTHITVFLLQVESADATQSPHRIRWCFAEEAQARIRRKPMRRLIDLAVRQMDP
jgi:8-oxo-dGTP pyrophosphatase MutT (NUDIX family)